MFSACQKNSGQGNNSGYNPENESVKKLPSKEIWTGGIGERMYQYDDLNRLITIIGVMDNHRYDIWYNDDHTPAKLRSTYGSGERVDTFLYKDNQVFIFTPPYIDYATIITLNSKGEILQTRHPGGFTTNYIYNSNGNVSKTTNSYGEITTITHYSSIPSMFRHVNTPDWFIYYYSWLGGYGNLIFNFSKKGYMCSFVSDGNVQYDNYYTYEVDSDGYGYVTKREISNKDGSDKYLWTYEYILAK
ncbi:MAG: hypothetical protein FWE63_08280 [Bacteroidales bacterium]|nr:hypothetical protein [Bacteroidales bacterium]